MDYTLTTFTTSSTNGINTIGNGGTFTIKWDTSVLPLTPTEDSDEYYERLLDQMDADKAYGEELKSL